ncbi:MAG: hypothetical protein M3426_10400 [Actinomycetota bacterium]|jgi:uncharacterized membrane protein YkoI|nr:hypothetical protein [Actinomycetota bacterium]
MVDSKRLLASAAVAAALTLGVGTAVTAQQGALPGQGDEAGEKNEAFEGRDSDESLTGSPARQAADAALRATDGGTVLEVERGDDPGAAYEVEVRKADGGVAEVLLDGDFDVIGQEAGD